MKIVNKGWGYEKILHNDNGYCGKILCFEKGKKCSFHYHKLKSEHFYCIGKIKVRYGWNEDITKAVEIILNTGDDFNVPVGLIHQMEAIEETQLFEFSTTDYEEDSYRILKGD